MLAAVIASISTPVGPVVRASAVNVIWPVSASICASTPTKVRGKEWHRGISSAVRLAAWMPAIRATPITSPFGASPASTLRAVSEDTGRIGLAVHDRLEELLAVLVGGQRCLGPSARVVEQDGQHRVRLAEQLGDLALHPLGQRR